MGMQWAIKIGGVIGAKGSSSSNSIKAKINTEHTLNSNGTTTISSNGKMATANLLIDNVNKASIGGKIMPSDIDIFTRITSGAGYDIISSSGNWTCPMGVSKVDLYIVGGGGGGMGNYCSRSGSYTIYHGGNGGNGGFFAKHTNISVTGGASYAVTIGTGGAGGAYSSVSPDDGGDGTATSIKIGNTTYTANGGNGGKSPSESAGALGGSGGGLYGSYDSHYGGMSYTAGAGGYNGADGGKRSNSSGTLSGIAQKGNGVSTYVSKTASYYCGGGGGGTAAGGSGGGGAGNIPPVSGSANTGGGGGGGGKANEFSSGASGGTGVVIIVW